MREPDGNAQAAAELRQGWRRGELRPGFVRGHASNVPIGDFQDRFNHWQEGRQPVFRDHNTQVPATVKVPDGIEQSSRPVAVEL